MIRKLILNSPLACGTVYRTPASHKIPLILLHRQGYTTHPFKTRENSMVRHFPSSFQFWVFNFFKNNPNYTTFETRNTAGTEVNIENMDLELILNYLCSKKAEESLTPFLLRRIDAELCAKISPKTPPSDLLKCLHVCATTVPIQVAKMESFQSSLFQLENCVRKSLVAPHDVVQTMYYASLLKSRPLIKRFMEVAVWHLNVDKLENLSVTDLGIYCVSLFRSAVPVEQLQLLRYLDDRFRRELPALISVNSAIFVSFVKCFRLSKHYNGDLLRLVAEQGLGTVAELDSTARIHLAVWFAAAEYGDVEFVGPLLSSCVTDMAAMIAENAALRLKDFDNLLWASAFYGLDDVLQVVQSTGIARYIGDRLWLARNDPHLQVSLLTWLWMCGCQPEREVAQCITLNTITFIKGSKHFKSMANLFLLMTCVEVEAPGLLKPAIINTRDSRLQPKVPKYLEKRPRLKQLLAVLQKHSGVLQLDNLRFAFQVPALYIGGIYAEHLGRPLCIEVLDPAVCLSNSQHLKGRMKLKLRLLEKMGLPVLQVAASESYEIDNLRQLLSRLPNSAPQ